VGVAAHRDEIVVELAGRLHDREEPDREEQERAGAGYGV